ncbi:hypothetical protein FSW04_02300 [Baekduia soli]|uniref:Uncharacterized protein n=1 Tax=Baekduia soli TaxID=496014 RepID=A0A5B8U0I3_9ACTN|nr:hypothetical protein [Baekduia soli]QEC46523.1 hypothetical protein FSW04_02300 [Baekduia soli]
MCGLCGTPAPPGDWIEAGIPDTPADRMQARLGCAAVLARVGRATGVTVREGLAFGMWTVSAPTGATAIAGDLAEVWPTVTRLAGRPADPLDAGLLHRLEAGG